MLTFLFFLFYFALTLSFQTDKHDGKNQENVSEQKQNEKPLWNRWIIENKKLKLIDFIRWNEKAICSLIRRDAI